MVEHCIKSLSLKNLINIEIMRLKPLSRRQFMSVLSAGSAALAFIPANGMIPASRPIQTKPATNIADASKVARKQDSMPGLFPGKVVMTTSSGSVINDVPVESQAYTMLKTSLISLTGEKDLKSAWGMFVKPGEKIGLKVNPVAGKELTTSHAVVKSVVKQLTECGISRDDIIIWDRRMSDLTDTGFNSVNYQGIKIMGTEIMDEKGSFTDASGKFYSEKNIDKEWFYWADEDGQYDSETMPYMINSGKYSYYTKIVTNHVDKIINIPILKNAGGSITNAMKNLAFGSISNTGRLHAKLWNDTCAEVCAFSPIRDKVVLNICDALRGCFNGGPAANPQFICNYNTLLVSTDPVAMDRIGYDIISAKRISEGIQKSAAPESLTFLSMATSLGLGVSDRSKIVLEKIDLG
jgi:uncharacterized protein (DUF362 family)